MRRFAIAVGVAVVGLVLGGVLAARPGDAAPQGATVTGRVRFTGVKPVNRRLPAMDEPVCEAKYTTPPTEETVIVNPNGTLANVFVYVKTGLPADAKYQAPATPVELDQTGCRYVPHVFGIMVGQTLRIKNSDGILHTIKFKGTKNRLPTSSQPRVMTTDRVFSAEEVTVLLECNVHGWMQAYVGVLPYPFFAVTGTDGSFSIKGLPPGTYTIEAWHEKYGTQTATVTVTGTGAKTQDFTFAAR